MRGPTRPAVTSIVPESWEASSAAASFPPRVLLVIPDHWHRALLRAELRELGYDALGAPDLAGSLLYPADEPDRGPVSLIVLDQRALTPIEEALLPELRARHHALVILLAPAGTSHPAGRWARVLTRPVSIGEITRSVQELRPLSGNQAGLDRPPGA